MTDLSFVKAGSDKKQELKKLWLLCFDEDSKAADVFFDEMYDLSAVYVAQHGSKAVAALYLLPCTINGNKAHYLCGAATLMEYRKNGIMAKLIEYALDDAQKNGDVFSVLFPANDGLYSFYSRFGYVANCSCSVANADRAELEKYVDNSINIKTPLEYENLQKLCFKNNFLLWNNKFLDFAKKYYGIYGVTTVSNNECLAVFEEKNNTVKVIYSVYTGFSKLAALLLKNTAANKFVFTFKSDKKALKNSVKEKYGMIKLLDNTQKIPDDIFIGLTLN